MIQNKYSLYDNCVFEECKDEDSFIELEDRCEETGKIICKRPLSDVEFDKMMALKKKVLGG